MAGRAAAAAPRRGDAPPRVVAKLRAICLALPGASEEQAWVGTRWVVRTRNFAHVVTIDGGWPPAYARAAGSDGPIVVLTVRADGALAEGLRTTGPRCFVPDWGTTWGTRVLGLVIDQDTDWAEVTMLVTASHQLLAPRRRAGRATPASGRPRR